MADKNNDLYELSKSDLVNKVISLKEDINELKCAKEADAQRIYELRRQLDTSKAAQAYLMQELELESRNADASTADSESTKKLKGELEEWRKKYNAMKMDFENLQADQEAHLKEIDNLKENLKQISKKEVAAAVPKNEAEEFKNRAQLLEEEYMALLQKMDELQNRDMANIFALGAKDREIEILKDQIVSLEENLKSKKEDLEEKIQMLETTQDQLSDANSKIALLSASADDKTNTKGNSLFAEVDDQRQAMKQLLNVQKKRFLEMKKKYNESDHEIRRLRREKNAIHAELDTCGKIFTKSRQDFYDNLMARIRQLQSHNERLEKQLKWTEENLKRNAGQNVPWLDSMLKFCKQETSELKAELRKIRMDKASLDETIRNLQHESARYRFENLRLRLSLSEYENILNDNKIQFTPPSFNDISKMVSEMSEKQKMNLLDKYKVVDNEIENIEKESSSKIKETIVTSKNDATKKEEFACQNEDHTIISLASNNDTLERKINETAIKVKLPGLEKDHIIMSSTSTEAKLENKINENENTIITSISNNESLGKKQECISSTSKDATLENEFNEKTTKVDYSWAKKDQTIMSSTPNDSKIEIKLKETNTTVDHTCLKMDQTIISLTNDDTLENKLNETATKLDYSWAIKGQTIISSTSNDSKIENKLKETNTTVNHTCLKMDQRIISLTNDDTLENKLNETATKLDYSWSKKDQSIMSSISNDTVTKGEIIKIKEDNKLDLIQDNVKTKLENVLIMIDDKENIPNISNETNAAVEKSSLGNDTDINSKGLSSILKTSNSILSGGNKKVQFSSPIPSEKNESENKIQVKYNSPTITLGNGGEEESKTTTSNSNTSNTATPSTLIGRNKTNVKILRMKIRSAPDNSKSLKK